jgi:chemotaxis protein MotB
MAEGPPIIKKVKKGHGGGHHGGAWKVAYADFVTAMMAFFLVMWIVGLNQAVKQSVAAYFKDPIGFMKGVEQGRKPFNVQAPGALSSAEVRPDLRKDAQDLQKRLQQDKERFSQAKHKIEREVVNNPEFRALSKSIQVRIAQEGMRIDLMESTTDVFFDSGSATPKSRTRDLLVTIAQELGKLPNRIVIEGHTDSKPFAGKNGWTNWELSAARANAARAIMEASGIRAGQVLEVRGLADRMPIDPAHKDSFKNRRVSILLPFQSDEAMETLNIGPGGLTEEVSKAKEK